MAWDKHFVAGVLALLTSSTVLAQESANQLTPPGPHPVRVATPPAAYQSFGHEPWLHRPPKLRLRVDDDPKAHWSLPSLAWARALVGLGAIMALSTASFYPSARRDPVLSENASAYLYTALLGTGLAVVGAVSLFGRRRARARALAQLSAQEQLDSRDARLTGPRALLGLGAVFAAAGTGGAAQALAEGDLDTLCAATAYVIASGLMFAIGIMRLRERKALRRRLEASLLRLP